MKLIIASIILLSLTVMCSTTKYVPVETVKTEYRDKIVRDSIFRYDSIFVKEKGDTVFIEKYLRLYIDRILRDSVIVRDTIRIPYPVPYPVEVVKEVKKASDSLAKDLCIIICLLLMMKIILKKFIL